MQHQMTSAEFKAAREFLGLPTSWLAAHLRNARTGEVGIRERTVMAMDRGELAVSTSVADQLAAISEATDAAVAQLITESGTHPGPLVTYRSDADYRAAYPDTDYPAAWHRQICRRAAEQTRGLRIAYAHELVRPATQSAPTK